jgi:hypothetical protein
MFAETTTQIWSTYLRSQKASRCRPWVCAGVVLAFSSLSPAHARECWNSPLSYPTWLLAIWTRILLNHQQGRGYQYYYLLSGYTCLMCCSTFSAEYSMPSLLFTSLASSHQPGRGGHTLLDHTGHRARVSYYLYYIYMTVFIRNAANLAQLLL